MATTLRSEGLIKIYKKRKVVNKASVEVSKGEIVGLLGPNGAGKTTTFYMIMGMIKPEAGRVFLDDKEITKVPMYQRAKMGVGYLPQENSIFRRLSVEDNLMAVLEMTNLKAEQRNEKMERLLDELSIKHIRKSKGFQLSGGERRRTEIARALATDPSFILLDEPFAGIDPIAVEDIMNIVANLKNRGIGILITDHNVHETLSIVDKAYILINGVIFKQGTADELANDEEVKKLYLGEKFRLDRYS
ncbi:LPS export ABC transporter ATP-binding protein [bacterium BMS3Abin03]|nr:LPS export ABC transporter ATP-binding protein [bacterium BMS3Abin03]MCG6961604.1 LPS export ABC transporter ATP-binding protein [bacterium BMS3Abin03]